MNIKRLWCKKAKLFLCVCHIKKIHLFWQVIAFFCYVAIKISHNDIRGGSRASATSKMECFVIIVNGFQPLTIITKHSILDVAAALDPPLDIETKIWCCMKSILLRKNSFMLRKKQSDTKKTSWFCIKKCFMSAKSILSWQKQAHVAKKYLCSTIPHSPPPIFSRKKNICIYIYIFFFALPQIVHLCDI